MGLKGLVEQPWTLLKARQAGVGLSSAGKFVPMYMVIFELVPGTDAGILICCKGL